MPPGWASTSAAQLARASRRAQDCGQRPLARCITSSRGRRAAARAGEPAEPVHACHAGSPAGRAGRLAVNPNNPIMFTLIVVARYGALQPGCRATAVRRLSESRETWVEKRAATEGSAKSRGRGSCPTPRRARRAWLPDRPCGAERTLSALTRASELSSRTAELERCQRALVSAAESVVCPSPLSWLPCGMRGLVRLHVVELPMCCGSLRSRPGTRPVRSAAGRWVRARRSARYGRRPMCWLRS